MHEGLSVRVLLRDWAVTSKSAGVADSDDVLKNVEGVSGTAVCSLLASLLDSSPRAELLTPLARPAQQLGGLAH
jgi:hypothetical protein